MTIVSIIIPIYNVEQYITACLESVVAQTYTDYEVILVDDCGTDKSMDVALEYIQHTDIAHKFRIVRHEHNKGNSAARNTGIAAAKGEYIYQLDDDDTMTPDCLEKLVKEAERTDADMVVGNFKIIGEDKWVPLFQADKKYSADSECFHDYLHEKYQMMVWNKLVRRDFLERNGITFIEGLTHEDNAWSFSVACTIKKIAYVHDVTYLYVIRGGGLHAHKNFKKHYDSYCFLINYYVDEARKYGKADDPVFRWWLERQKALYFGQTLHSGTDKQLHEIYAIIRQSLPMKGWNKMQIHYQLPAWLGILAYKKWHGMWLV